MNESCEHTDWKKETKAFFQEPTPEERERWLDFIRITGERQSAMGSGVGSKRSSFIAPIRNISDLATFIRDDISCGYTFWTTDKHVYAGMVLDAVIIHPINRTRYVFPIHVKSVDAQERRQGFWVSLRMLDVDAFMHFVEQGLLGFKLDEILDKDMYPTHWSFVSMGSS